MVTDEDCAACDFNRPGKTCLRRMEWVWRGETYAATSSEYFSLKNQLQVRPALPVTTGISYQAEAPVTALLIMVVASAVPSAGVVYSHLHRI